MYVSSLKSSLFFKRDNSLLNYCNILDKLLQDDILCKYMETKNHSGLKKKREYPLQKKYYMHSGENAAK